MLNFERNKIFAAVLISLIVILLINNFVDLLYNFKKNINHRGYVLISQNIQKNTIIESIQSENNDSSSYNIQQITEIMAKANAELGMQVARKCLACHTFEHNGIHKIGPNLFNVTKRKKASADKYKYSQAFSKLEGIWSDEELAQFLYAPKDYVPGTKMMFPGIKNIEQLANLILYMKNNSN